MLEVILLIAAVVIGLYVVMNMDVTPRATSTQVVPAEPETTADPTAGPASRAPAASSRPQTDPGQGLAA